MVSSTFLAGHRFTADKVLVLGDVDNDGNYWLAERGKTEGEGFIMKIHSCERMIAGFFIKNRGNGDNRSWLSKQFRVSGSLSDSGPWEKLVEAELIDTRHKPPALLNFTFDQPLRIQFLKFDLISYWSSSSNEGGGLQYFFPILSEGKCSYLNQVFLSLIKTSS